MKREITLPCRRNFPAANQIDRNIFIELKNPALLIEVPSPKQARDTGTCNSLCSGYTGVTCHARAAADLKILATALLTLFFLYVWQ